MKAIYQLLTLALLFVFLGVGKSTAQTVIAFQGGEGTASDNWTFQPITNAGGGVPPGIVAFNPRTGTNALRAGGGNNLACASGTNCITGGANSATGCAMHGNTIQFDPINVSCLNGVQLSAYHSSQPITCSGAGFDGSDNLNFEVRLDGGAWTNIQAMATIGDYNWNYATNPTGLPATVPNPWTYAVPPGTTTFEFRVRATVNRSDEVFYLDDVTLTTTSTAYGFPGTPGLWHGAVDDNWFNACNWNDRQVPTALTNVTFPTGSLNDIVIQAGQNCQCNDLTCTGGVGRAIRAAANPTKVLSVMGNLNINTTPGSTVLQFTDGALGTPDGTLNLGGNWTNNSSAADFVEGEGTVNFIGAANQTITLATVEPSENFCNFTVNKAGGDVVLAKSVQVLGFLTLTNGKITTAANAVGVANMLPGAVTGHSVASYVNGNLVRAIQTGAGARVYDFPLGTAANYELASLNLINPAGFTVIAGFFNPAVLGVAPNIVEGLFLYNTILNAGVWTLAPDLPYVGSYDITLTERGYTNGGATSYIDVKRVDALALWTNPGTHVSFSEVAGVVTCTRSGLTAFSDFAIALSNAPFALDDLGMDASVIGGGDIAVAWSWSDRMVQGKFDLVREHDGQQLKVGEWPIGNALAMSVQDASAPTGLLHYTLYHTDLDGNRTLAASDEVFNSSDDNHTPLLWPNPNDGRVHLQLGGDADWQLELVGVDGRQVCAFNGDAASIQQSFEAAVPHLSPGVYFLKCRTGNETFHLKMLRN